MLNLFVAVDGGFAMPLAVALQSALDNLKTVDQVRIVVASAGIDPADRQKLAAIVARADVEASVDFVVPDADLFSGFPTTRWHGHPVYLRDPKIMHYSGASKPWHYLYRRSMDKQFFHYLAESRWFASWTRTSWEWGRRFAHFALHLFPNEALTVAKHEVERLKSR